MVNHKQEGEQRDHIFGECIVTKVTFGNHGLFWKNFLTNLLSSGEIFGWTGHFSDGSKSFANEFMEIVKSFFATFFLYQLLGARFPSVVATADGRMGLVGIFRQRVNLVHSGQEIIVASGLVS